ncbi:MAG TPA: hypothetical protein VEX60_01130 [Pyrinomonadaceae bacterium]|nr:hypothetical protein [Pyrinomonadaceae bacterium]
MRTTLPLKLSRTCFALLLLFFVSTAAPAQDGRPATPAPSESSKAAAKVDEKAVAVIERAVESLGGRAYLNVKTIVSRGYFTQMREGGVQGIPINFHDYMVFPDRERTEFSGAGVKSIQVNVGESGWVADLKSKKLLDVTEQQAQDFRLTLRTSLDNVLRGWWRAEGASLTYAGRREAGLARRNEVVRLTYPDGFAVEFEFDAKEGTPAKVKYKKLNAEGEMVEEEDRYAQFITVGAVRAPFIIDHYRAGVQSSRVNYDEVEFNQTVPDSLFTKPADVKKVKF